MQHRNVRLPDNYRDFRKFLQYMAEDGTAWYGMFLAFLLLMNNLMQTFFLQRYFYIAMQVGMRQRTALIDLVYRKVSSFVYFDSENAYLFIV